MRTGLLGASAAVAMGVVAVASGLVPGPGGSLGGALGGLGGPGGRVQADGPEDAATQGMPDGLLPPAPSFPSSTASRSATGSASPSASRSPGAHDRHGSAGASAGAGKGHDKGSASASGGTATGGGTGSGAAAGPQQGSTLRAPADPETAAEAEVLGLVNQERARAGCTPVTADTGLAALADAFSDDMAARGFFDHTDPDGATPWDRAKKRGITGLGGENIARGQANAQSVMDSWMNSPGHRANILNCDYRTLGVGAHFGPGGPWWTQDFGF